MAKFLLLCIFLSSIPAIIVGEKLFLVKATSYQCTEIDPVHIVNMTCRLKSKRHGAGIISTVYKYNNANHVYNHMQLFYRNSGGRYLPYLLDLTLNFCERPRLYKNGPIMVKLVLEVLYKNKEYLTYECPFNYTNYILDFDLDEQVAKYFPSNFVAAGEYKYLARFFNGKTNRTYFTQMLRYQVSANGVKGSMADLSMLNMG